MARLTLPELADMTEQQRLVHDEAAGGLRGHAPAPLTAWIRNPELARRAQRLGELMRYETSLPRHSSELAILVTARHWASHYEWKVHRQTALQAGVPQSVITSIAERSTPVFETAADRAVYEISTSLLTEHRIPQALYEEGLRQLGEVGLVDLVGVLGYYGMVSMTLNAFEIGLPDAYQQDLAPGD